MADVLENPFGLNIEHDIDLSSILEINIWRCSVTIQQQSLSHPPPCANQWERWQIQKKALELNQAILTNSFDALASLESMMK